MGESEKPFEVKDRRGFDAALTRLPRCHKASIYPLSALKFVAVYSEG